MLKPIRPYISVDIETTGLDTDKVHMLEIGAVLDDGVSPVEQLKTFHAVIKVDNYNPIRYGEEAAMKMNEKLIELCKIQGTDLHDTMVSFLDFMRQGVSYCDKWDLDNGKKVWGKVCLAGKNAMKTDIPVIRNHLRRLPGNGHADSVGSLLVSFDSINAHRTIDVGSMYYDGDILSLGEINKITGRNECVSHRALDDAFDVVHAVRHFYNWRSRCPEI